RKTGRTRVSECFCRPDAIAGEGARGAVLDRLQVDGQAVSASRMPQFSKTPIAAIVNAGLARVRVHLPLHGPILGNLLEVRCAVTVPSARHRPRPPTPKPVVTD